MGLAELLARAANLADLTDEELATLQTDLLAAAEAIDVAAADDDTLVLLEQAGEAAEAIRTEQTAREQDATARAERAQAALDRIRGQEDDGDGDGEGTDGDGDGAGDGEGEGAAGDGTEPPATEPGDGEGEGTEAETPEQIAAAAAAAAAPPARTPQARANARRPAEARPRAVPQGVPVFSLTAGANAPGMVPGAPIKDYGQLAEAFKSAIEATADYQSGPRKKITVARAKVEFRNDVMLDDNITANMRKIEQAQALVREHGSLAAAATAVHSNGIQASGGICAPQEARYDMPTVGTDARPFRDQAMLRFGADRGGIRTLPIPTLADVDGAITVWDNPTDITPGGETKACLEVTCPAEDETLIEAIVRCLQTGNFRLRYLREQIEAWMRLTGVAHARAADNRLIATVAAGSKDVPASALVSATRDVLAVGDQLVTGFRSFHRIGDNEPFTWALPNWLRSMIRTDIMRQMPVGTIDETMAVADATIDRWFSVRNVNPVWFLDGEAGQVFGAQVDGQPPVAWPSDAIGYMYPAGSWLFLDGGELDLGIVRDSVLNSTNDVQMFAETMEGGHFHGIDSYRTVIEVCPNGRAGALVDIEACAAS